MYCGSTPTASASAACVMDAWRRSSRRFAVTRRDASRKALSPSFVGRIPRDTSPSSPNRAPVVSNLTVVVSALGGETMRAFTFLLAATLLAACSSSGRGGICAPGATQACVCSDGRGGAQSCNGAGSGYGGCICGSPTGDAGAGGCSPSCSAGFACSGTICVVDPSDAGPTPADGGPDSCQTYCQRSGDCLGRLDDVPACIAACRSAPPPGLDSCASCFGSHSCPDIAASSCAAACVVVLC